MSHTDRKGIAGFLTGYVFSTDHKVIAKQYLWTGLIMALVGGWIAMRMRAQLAWPYESFGFYPPMDPGHYNALVTMHGSIMVFWVAMPILLGAFGNFLIPLMIGAEDMAFPRLNMLSYWTFLVSTVILLGSFFVPDGAIATGWTVYPPLSAVNDLTGVTWGTDLWILAVALEFASALMGGVNFLTTAVCMRAPGMKLMEMPIFVWMQLAASVIFMLSVGPLIAAAVMLLLERNLGATFFAPDAGGDPLLWQHLFWFFGHPEVYVVLLPAVGIMGEILTTFSRKPLFGHKAIIIATFVAGFLSFIVWAHHQFIAGIDPGLALPFSLLTILISVPFAYILFSYIATLWRGSIRFSTAMLFAVGTLAMFLIGGTTGIPLGATGSDIYFHDTYFVVAHFHYTMFPSTILGMFAAIYFWFPKMFGRMMNEALGKVHFWLTLLFFNTTFIPLFFVGLGGQPRRYADPRTLDLLQPEYESMALMSTWSAIGLMVVQIPFVWNFCWSMFKGRAAARNPWDATTVEWLAPSPPGHGNFEGQVQVERPPYEYNPPESDVDYLPQGRVVGTPA